MKPKVLTFIRHYLPGYEFGGPVRSLSNLVENLNDSLEFRIVTLDRDVSANSSFPGIAINHWNDVGKAKVYYLSPEACSFATVTRLMQRTEYDLIYLNSFFDRRFTLWPIIARRFGLIRPCPVVIAPRGEFSLGAIKIKRWKKIPFLWITKGTALFRGLIWQASSEYEADEIRRAYGSLARQVVVARNLPGASHAHIEPWSQRGPGAPLRVLFLSRITQKKNLDLALRALAHVSSPVSFTIAGPLEDISYWEHCERLIRSLPPHVTATYRGAVEPSSVACLMADHDLFFLPTRGENYGHVIAEALQAGTPVLISDTTPWRNLEQHRAGWELPLASEVAFAQQIDQCARLPPLAYSELRRSTHEFAKQFAATPDLLEANRNLFLNLVESPTAS